VSDFIDGLQSEQPVAAAPTPRGRAVKPWLAAVAAAVVVIHAIAGILLSRGVTPTATATEPTTAPSPAVAGQLLLTDPLTDSASPVFAHNGSGTGNDPTAYQWDFAYAPSGLLAHIAGSTTAGTWLTASSPLPSVVPIPRDFAVQVRARVTRAPGVGGFGLGVQAGPDAEYGFDVTPADRGYRFIAANNPTPLESGHSNWIEPAAQPNLVRVELFGNNVRLVLNGHEVIRTTRPELGGRQAATVALRWAMSGPPNAGNSVEVQFTQFALYALR
jgi:hypothetical protein